MVPHPPRHRYPRCGPSQPRLPIPRPRHLSEIFWVLTIVLLILFLFLYALHICLYPRVVAKTLATDITETAGLASISITFTTIIQMIALALVSSWSPRWGLVAYVLWWINTAM